MGLGVNARTAFSLFFPRLIEENGWDRGMSASVFSVGFLMSAAISPLIGRMMDRAGPVVVMELGAILTGGGLLLTSLSHQLWQLQLTLGMMVAAGSVCLGYTGQSAFLPNWFERKRGLAVGIAFGGVGVGSVVLMPWLQSVIADAGWRSASRTYGLILIGVLVPINLLLKKQPSDVGLLPDGDAGTGLARTALSKLEVVDRDWAARDWTLKRALGTKQFWFLALGYFFGLFIWYAVQVHQTKYLLEVGFDENTAAWALGAVGLAAIPGQVILGFCSDRIGREWVWTISAFGFGLCFVSLIGLQYDRSYVLLYLMVAAQGGLGYGASAIMGAVVAELFAGRHFGSIFGMVMLAGILGGAAGPWLTAVLHDWQGGYGISFTVGILVSVLWALMIWLAGPRKVRAINRR
jgi:sugar phosphate permease